MWKGKKPEKALKVTYFEQCDGKGQEVNWRKLPPIRLTQFELAPTLMNKMGVVQNVYYPNGDTPIF